MRGIFWCTLGLTGFALVYIALDSFLSSIKAPDSITVPVDWVGFAVMVGGVIVEYVFLARFARLSRLSKWRRLGRIAKVCLLLHIILPVVGISGAILLVFIASRLVVPTLYGLRIAVGICSFVYALSLVRMCGLVGHLCGSRRLRKAARRLVWWLWGFFIGTAGIVLLIMAMMFFLMGSGSIEPVTVTMLMGWGSVVGVMIYCFVRYLMLLWQTAKVLDRGTHAAPRKMLSAAQGAASGRPPQGSV